MSNEERETPTGFYGHWAKHLIENGAEVEDDTDELEEDSVEYDFDEYLDEEE
tara:strand:+ start:131 stop:286 length:156 start_codon:yes stop_codon:yes gene_type:complete